jgi:hypothetical protein
MRVSVGSICKFQIIKYEKIYISFYVKLLLLVLAGYYALYEHLESATKSDGTWFF